MSSPTPMMLYAGHLAIGEIRDGGAGQVAATYIEPSGRTGQPSAHNRRRLGDWITPAYDCAARRSS